MLPSLALPERQNLPECSAIYFAIAREQVLYVGLATNLRKRWQNHHRLLQLEAVNKKCEVSLFWLQCSAHQLDELERQYIEHYCPTFNQTKVPQRKIVPSYQTLTLSLEKLNHRILGLGVCPATNQQLKTLILGYLADSREMQRVTTTVRKSLRAINNKPDSLLRWVEVIRRQNGAHWLTRCNGMEIRLIPWSYESLMHNPSMYQVVSEKCFDKRIPIPMAEYDAMRKEVRAMSSIERLELARSSEIGQKLFPYECAAQFRAISGVEILCLTQEQLQNWLSKNSRLQESYPGIHAIESDPLPKLF